MSKLDGLIREKIQQLESSSTEFNSSVIRAQVQVLNEVLQELDGFELDSQGRLKASQGNALKLTAITDRLKRALVGSEYLKAVAKFVGDFEKTAAINDEIARQIKKDFEPSTFQRQILKFRQAEAVSQLFGDALTSRVAQAVNNAVINAMSTNDSLTNLRQQIRTVLIEQGDGALVQYTKTYANTAQSVAERAYSSGVAIEIGAEWFRYAGGEIDTTRLFCEERAGKVFHKKEIESWADEQWQGQIEGTNRNNIFTLLGGWNCRHTLIPIPFEQVPAKDVSRAIEKGYYIARNS
jgi:hypothetical protein